MTPARISWNMSAAYKREQDGHTDSRRLQQRTTVEPSASSADEYVDSTSPVVLSKVVDVPTRWIGFEQNPTRDAASDHASKSLDSRRATICFVTASPWWGRSSGCSGPPVTEGSAPQTALRA